MNARRNWNYWMVLVLATGLILLAACSTPTPTPAEQPAPANPAQANLPNPASVYCQQQGYRLEIHTAADSSQSGDCIFPDGSRCDEWMYFRGECQPGNTPSTAGPADADLASDGCKIYRNSELGYSFHYPAEASIQDDDNPLHGISVVWPVQDSENWPMFSIAHPSDREEYRPPENVALLQWLNDHNLLGDTRMPDEQIAEATAVHLRHDRSPQTYAFDRYYFARAGQLYMIIIGHTGDREDWELYEHFLGSFQFEQG